MRLVHKIYFKKEEIFLINHTHSLTGGLLRGDVLPLSPGGLFRGICCLVGGRQASRGAAAHLSLGALPYGSLLQEHSAATEAKLAPQAHQWPTPANHTPNYALIRLV